MVTLKTSYSFDSMSVHFMSLFNVFSILKFFNVVAKSTGEKLIALRTF